MAKRSGHDSKLKLLDAALHVVRAQGYAATTVDDICRYAGVTKGSFFHHFQSKDALALAAIAHWDEVTTGFFASAPYRKIADPLDRLFGYIAFREAIATGELPEYTCFLGTLVQETYLSHTDIRIAAERSMSLHIDELTKDAAAAKALYAPDASWTPESVGQFIQTVLQGAFIFAKAQQGPAVVYASLAHLRTYLDSIFHSRSLEKT